jgi:hypothetical protein
VTRADGTTVSSQGHNGLLVNSLPGTIDAGGHDCGAKEIGQRVVLRGFKDWTQIISTFVIGAAAAKVLFP